MKADEKKRIRNDIILIVLFFFVAVVIGMFLYGSYDSNGNYEMQIILDGELIETYTYSKDDTYKEFLIDTGNVIVLDEGEVYMKSASCPDGLCIKQGKISFSGESIICLPNKLVVKIVDISNYENDKYSEDGLDVMPR